MNFQPFLLCILLLFSYPLLSFAQIQEEDDLSQIAQQQEKFFIAHTKISVNNVFLDGTNYIETKISPFFKIGGFYLGLDFPLKIGTDKGGILNVWTYLSPYNYLQFINAIGYTTNSHIFDLKIGTISDLSWGEGLILSHFRNDLFLPNIRQLGLLLDLQWAPYIKVEYFASDIENFGLGGVSLQASPLAFMDASNPFSQLQISENFLYDIDTRHILYRSPDIINWKRNPKSSKRYLYSTSLRLPFWQTPNRNLTLGIALEQAGIISLSQYAFIGKFYLHYQDYQFQAGLGYLGNGFHWNSFSALYLQPSIRESRFNKNHGQNRLGYSVENSFSFFKSLFQFHLDIYGQSNPMFSIHTALELKPYLLRQLSILFGYMVEDVKSFSDIASKQDQSFLLAKLSYQFGDYANLGFLYRQAVHIEESNKNLRSSREISVQVGIIF